MNSLLQILLLLFNLYIFQTEIILPIYIKPKTTQKISRSEIISIYGNMFFGIIKQ